LHRIRRTEITLLPAGEARMKILIIDPPSGWKYGFPKELPEGIKDTNKWLVENGYPQHEIDSYGDHFYCRYWEHEVDE
jgi:hypothetical protein